MILLESKNEVRKGLFCVRQFCVHFTNLSANHNLLFLCIRLVSFGSPVCVVSNDLPGYVRKLKLL